MDSDKKPAEGTQATPAEGSAAQPSHDALAKPSDDVVDATSPDNAAGAGAGSGTAKDAKPAKQPSALKKLLKRFNVYLLLFLLVVVIGVIILAVSYLNGKKTPAAPSVADQTLTQDQLKQLANSNATVGGSGQTLTVQGNAVFSGNVLVRNNLNVAGTIQLGSQLSVPQLTVSGSTNLASTQINSLQVAQGTTFQGLVTVQNGMNVAGNSSFTGSVSVGSLTVTNLTMSGNAQLQVPNHLAFTGATPNRSISFGVLGNGGSASIFGSDTSGTINVNSGNNPTAGCFISAIFNQKFSHTPNIIISPINSGGAQTGYYAKFIPDAATHTGFQVCFSTAPIPNQAFGFSYFITD